MSVQAYIALGSNLDQPISQIRRAWVELAALPESQLKRQSSLYLSPPAGFSHQPNFINAVAELETELAPRTLLDALLEIEHAHGRHRSFRDAPRTLDLDLLLYGDLCSHEHGLTLPHPRMHERAFVLIPLLEIAPDIVIPGHGQPDVHPAAIQHIKRLDHEPRNNSDTPK